MADDHYSSKRKYDDPSPPPRRTGFSSGPPAASPPAGGAQSYNSVPPPPDEIQLAKQRAQEIAARIFNAAEAKRPRVDNGDDDVGGGYGGGGSLGSSGGGGGGGGRIGGGGLGFSSSAGGEIVVQRISNPGCMASALRYPYDPPGPSAAVSSISVVLMDLTEEDGGDGGVGRDSLSRPWSCTLQVLGTYYVKKAS